MVKQINLFLEVESTLGKDAVKTVEIASQGLEYEINFVDVTVTPLRKCHTFQPLPAFINQSSATNIKGRPTTSKKDYDLLKI